MTHTRVQRIQDSVHGLMEFRGMEAVVIDLLRTPELQRLRRIRQLGLGLLVFPGAEHSRLVHSLGAAHVAIRFGRQLEDRARDVFIGALSPDDATIRDLAVGALCHDLGHGPLSHAWEREIVGHEFDRAAWCKALGLDGTDSRLLTLKWHELVGHGLLAWPEGQLHQLLEQHEEGSAARIRELLLGDYYIPYMPALLSSDIDADRCDFIRRDTHQTGVAYGRYDLDWLISTCGIGRLKSDEWVIGFDDRKAIRVVEQFLIARRAMYETVYYHKTVRCAEGMMALFLRRLRRVVKEQGIPSLAALEFLQPIVRIIHGDALAQRDLLRLDDFTLSVLVESVAQPSVRDVTVRDLAKRISARDLFKNVRISGDRLNRYFRTPQALERLHEAIKPYVPGDPEYYLVLDETEFQMMADSPSQKVCLIRGDNVAYYATEHASFDALRMVKSENVRIFTVREAIEDVEKLISKSAPTG
jgi:HD superfamily phosphohydrolase